MKVEYRLRDLRWENYMSDPKSVWNSYVTPFLPTNTGIRLVNDGKKWLAEKILILGDEDES